MPPYDQNYVDPMASWLTAPPPQPVSLMPQVPQRQFAYASPQLQAAAVGGINGPDNIDVGGGYNPMGPKLNTPPGGNGDWTWLGNRNQQGVAGLALGGVQALGGLYLGMQQYNLAKESLANNKSQFAQQFAVQKNLTNSNLEDRQRARIASNSGAYQSVGDYMSQNGVK